MTNALFSEFIFGNGLSGLCIKDSHMHIGKIYHLPFDSDVEELIKEMKRLSIVKGIISCIFKYNERESENEYVKETVLKYGGIFKGQIFYSPTIHADRIDLIEEYMKSGIFSGIKIHPEINGVTVDNKGYEPIFEAAGFYRLPVLIHTWTKHIDILPINSLAENYPKTIFIMGHMGGKIEESFHACLDTIEKHDNVYADTALSWTYKGRIEYAVEKIGSHKILFASDANWNSIPGSLGRVICSKITDSQKEDILFRNFETLYGKD